MGDSPITAHSDCRLTFNQSHRDQQGFCIHGVRLKHYGMVLTEGGVSYNRSCLHLEGQFVVVSVFDGNWKSKGNLKDSFRMIFYVSMYLMHHVTINI